MKGSTPAIDSITVRVLTIPTDAPEADGTLSWNSTTMVLVEVAAGGKRGLGYTYSAAAAADIVKGKLAEAVRGRDAMDIPGLWQAMVGAVRNIGWRGVAANAISAVDIALWDLKARLLGLPLYKLLGAVRDEVPIYGSGGFTSYSNARLQEQLSAWVHEDGCRWVKMKIGSEPGRDLPRVDAARRAIGSRHAVRRCQRRLFPQAGAGLRRGVSPVSAGSRSRYRATISTACACCATARRQAWRSPPANTATTRSISATWSKAARSMSCRPMRPAAAASPVS